MTWVDLAVFGLLAVSALLAFVRGLVREVLGIGAWVGAIAAGIFGIPLLRGPVGDWIKAPGWADPASFAIVFLVALLFLTLVARAIGGLVRGSALGGVDRTLGLIFGLGRGAALVVIAYILAGMIFPIDRWPAPVLQARTLTPTYEGAKWLSARLPEEYRPRISQPRAEHETTADDLLRANPQGRATGKAAGRN